MALWELELDDFLCKTAFNTFGADINFTAFTIYLNVYFLKIRHKPAFIKIMRVTYIMSYHRFFSAYFTLFTHITPPCFFTAVGVTYYVVFELAR